MEYLKEYHNFVNEGNYTGDLIKKIVKEFGLDIRFIATFSTSILAFLPIMESLIANNGLSVDISQELIVLLSITAFVVVFSEATDDIKKLKRYLKERELINESISAINILTSVKKLYEWVVKRLGRALEFIVDMFTYTSLLTVFLLILKDLLNNTLSMDHLIGIGANIGVAALTVATKHIVKDLYKKMKNKIIKNKDIIETPVNEDVMNDYLNKKIFDGKINFWLKSV